MAASSRADLRVAGEDDEPVFDRFAVLREEKLLRVEDLMAAFSTPTRPFTSRQARDLIKFAGGFQFKARGDWRITKGAFQKAHPKLYALLLEHEVEDL